MWIGDAEGTVQELQLAAWFLAIMAAVVVLNGEEAVAQEQGEDENTKTEVAAIGSGTTPKLEALVPQDESFEWTTLSALLKRAKNRSPAIRRARAELEKGKAREEGTDVLTKYDPVVSVGIERFPLGRFSFGEFKAGVSQKFTASGERASRLRLAELRRRLEEHRFAQVRWLVHARVHRLYNQALVDGKRLELAARTRSFFRSLVEVSKKRREAGSGTKISVQLSKTEFARAKQEFVRIRSELVSRLESLVEISGWNRKALPMPKGTLPETRAELSEEKFVERARENYPPVRTFETAVEVAEQRHDFQMKKAWPDPTIGLFYKQQDPESSAPIHGLVAQFSVPIPLWNRNKRERMVSAAQRNVAETRLTTLRRKLEPKVSDAVQTLNAAAEQIGIFGQELIPAYERGTKLLRKGFRAGEFDMTDVAVAQERLLESRLQILNARIDYYEAAGRLERLLGDEFWPSVEKVRDGEKDK